MSRYWGETTPTDQSWDEPPSIYVFVFAQKSDLKYTQMSHKRPKLDEETNYLAGWMMRIHESMFSIHLDHPLGNTFNTWYQ